MLAAVGALASPALAASGPQVTITCTGTNNCTATGTGLTPSGRVLAQAYAGSSGFSSTNLLASATTLVCVYDPKPFCRYVGGGTFTTAVRVDYWLACDANAVGTVRYTDVSTGAALGKPVTWTCPCGAPTPTASTTTLRCPA